MCDQYCKSPLDFVLHLISRVGGDGPGKGGGQNKMTGVIVVPFRG